MNPVNTILHATREDKKKLNILTAPTHEAYEVELCKTGHNFYAYQHNSFKSWNDSYRPRPENYNLLSGGNNGQLPMWLDFDLVLSQNKFGQFQILAPVAKALQLPLISLEHTLPMPEWKVNRLVECANMRGNLNAFISEFSIKQWGWQNHKDTVVVHHGIDTGVFTPGNDKREVRILSVVNDWINRDWCCGFNIWRRTIAGLPAYVLGATPGLSRPAGSLQELVQAYQQSRIFYNTSTISPVPTVLLEAMACGCAVVSTATCMIPEIIQNGINGFISNDEKELRGYLELLLKDEELANKLGENARNTITEKFSSQVFVDNWNKVFYKCVLT